MIYNPKQVMAIQWGDSDFNSEVQEVLEIIAKFGVPVDKAVVTRVFPLLMEAVWSLRMHEHGYDAPPVKYFELDESKVALGVEEVGQAVKTWGVFVMYDARYGQATWAFDN